MKFSRWVLFLAYLAAVGYVRVVRAVDYTWIDTFGMGDWSVAGNWAPAAPAGPPNVGDTAKIIQLGSYTVNLDINTAVDAFIMDSPAATFWAVGRTFSVQILGNNATLIDGRVVLDGSTWTGAAKLRVLSSGLLDARGTATIMSAFENAGGLVSIVGDGGGPATLVVNGSVSNSGRIQLTSLFSAENSGLSSQTAADVVTNTGLIEFLVGAGGGRNLGMNLTNAAGGTVHMDVPFSFTGTHLINNGSWTMASGVLQGIPTTRFFTQAGGTLTLEGNSTLSVVPGGTFTLNGGVIAGTGKVTVTAGNLILGAGGTGAIELRAAGTVLGSPGVGHTLLVTGLGGLISNQMTGGSITNAGTIRLTSIGAASAASFLTPLPTDTITNTGKIEFLAGAGGVRTLGGNLTNNAGGSVQMDVPVTFGSDDLANSGTWNIANGITLALSGAAKSFT